MGVEVWLFVAALVLAAWSYSRRRHSYWSSRGIPSPPALPFLGHIHNMLSIFHFRWVYFDEVYHKYGGATLCGLYELFRPVLMIGDPDILKHICIKDFDHFVERRPFPAEKESLMNEMLINKYGDEWKALRSAMSPTFTSGKLRGMFPLICDKADSLVSFTLSAASKQPYVDMKENFGRFTMDTIASCAFGIECNSFRDKKPEFAKWASDFFDFSFVRLIKFTLFNISPKLFNDLGIKMGTFSVEFFQRVAEETIAARKAGQKRNDFLDLLLDAQAGHNLPTTAHVSAASHTQSTTDDSAATDNLKNNSQYSNSENKNISTTSKQETLRVYPPGTTGERICTKTYKIPGTELIVHPGDLVYFPIWSLHHDSRYFPNPEEFLPDRFLPENKDNITSFTHMPFGMGPRNCIAMRFALMEAKVALAKLLLKVELHLKSDFQEVRLAKSPIILTPEGGVHLVIKPLATNIKK
ncbi:cytochrome P450 9e2 isoform X2 [Cherax quadricarinatus]|uniref:cytochrome P450 9e2 isoform X2 n=1 Tax=Cherax quadricarinatus TaxID=27406 RepID=UPI00387ED93C